LGQALLIFVPAMSSGSLVGSDIEPTEVVAAVRNTSVEVVLPKGGRGLQLSCTRGSMVLPVDRVGSPPDFDFTDEGDARVAARRSPHRWRAVLVSVSSDMSGEVGDQLGALGKILAPNGMIMKCFPEHREAKVAGLGRWNLACHRTAGLGPLGVGARGDASPSGGRDEIRLEGLNPTRFPNSQIKVLVDPSVSVTLAQRTIGRSQTLTNLDD
jgi:hypothetical protein